MAWVTPRDWVALEIPTEAIFNAHLRDQLNHLYDGAGRLLPNDTKYSFGAAVANSTCFQVYTGTFAGDGSACYGFHLTGSLNPAAGVNGIGALVSPFIFEASSGTHPIIAGLFVQLSIGGGTAATTVAASIYAAGFTAPAGTVTAASVYVPAAPTGATSNYQIYAAGTGASRFDGLVGINTSPAAGIQLDVRNNAGNAAIQATGSGLDTLQIVASTSGSSIIKNASNSALLFGTNNTARWRISAGGDLVAVTSYAIQHAADNGFLDLAGGSTASHVNGASIRVHGVSSGAAPGAVQILPGATGANANIYLYTSGPFAAVMVRGTDGGVVFDTTSSQGWMWNSTNADGGSMVFTRSTSTVIGKIGTAAAIGIGSAGNNSFAIYANTILEIEAATEVRSATIWAATGGGAVEVLIDSTGKLWRNTSSRRNKRNEEFISLSEAQRVVGGLTAMKFERIGTPGIVEPGLIAEDVARVCREMAVFGQDGQLEGVRYNGWVYMLPVVQDHEDRITNLEKRVQ